MTRHPRVSVIMLVYDAERYLRESIDSILRQTFKDFEILTISEHGTSNESIAIIESYDDPRIRHIHNTVRLGYSASLNVGLKEARGEYVAIQDADDVSSPVRLETEARFLDQHPHVGVVGSWFDIIDENGRVTSRQQLPVESALIKWRLLYHNYIAHPSAMVRRQIYDRLGGYDTQYEHGSDYELWTRAALITELVNLPEQLLLYRQHKTSMTRVGAEDTYRNALAISKKAIRTVCGDNMSLEFLHIIMRPYWVVNPKDALAASIKVRDLCLQYIRRTCISQSECRLIRYDAAEQMRALAVACVRKNVLYSFMILSNVPQLCRELTPLFIASFLVKIATGFLHRMRITLKH